MSGEHGSRPQRNSAYNHGESTPAAIPPAIDRRRKTATGSSSANSERRSVMRETSAGNTTAPPAFAPNRRRPAASARQITSDAATTNRRSSYEPKPIAYTPVERPSAGRTSTARGSSDGGRIPPQPPHTRKPRKRRRHGRRLAIFGLVVVLVLAWPAWLLWDTNRNLRHVDALVPGPDTPGTTYLLAGSDSREDGTVEDDTEGERSDSIILMHVAPNGQTAMVSLPRDTYVDIPGYGYNKLNAAFSYGGAPLLVETVQNLTGLTVDHYAQVNMGGFINLVNAVDGVHVCLDYDVDEPHSGLKWTAGCKTVNGDEALAFARMRYQDPRGDLGRAQRQREVISQVTKKALSPKTLFSPSRQLDLSRAGVQTIYVDQSMSIFDLAKLLWAFKGAGKSGLSGTPPISSLGEETNAGLSLILDEDLTPIFFEKLANGQLTADDFETQF